MARRVAQVIVDIDVAHLDRPFDYLIPSKLDSQVQVGSLVRVRWGEKRVNAWVIGIADSSTHQLKPLLAVMSAEPLFTPELLATYRYVATRYAATLSQVLSVSIPARRALAERSLPPPPTPKHLFPDAPPLAETYLMPELTQTIRLVATVVPHLELETLKSLLSWASARKIQLNVVVPTAAQAERIYREVRKEAGEACALHVAEGTAATRYMNHLRCLRGDFQVVIGTLATAWLPSAGPCLTVVWDANSDLARSRRTPQADALDIAVARSVCEGHGLICASFSRSIKAQALVESHWAGEAVGVRSIVRKERPRVSVVGPEQFEREGATALLPLPTAAFDLVRRALSAGPVLIQVPSPGRTVEFDDVSVLRGAERVAADLGRAFPGVPVKASSSSSKIVRKITSKPQIVVATSGAEPLVAGGYEAVIVTEAEVVALADRLGAEEEALRRWFATFALAAPDTDCLLCGIVPPHLARSLALWNPQVGLAPILSERQELGFFPFRWMVAIDGESHSVEEVASQLLRTKIEPPPQRVGTVELEQEDEGALFSSLRVRTIIAVLPGQAMDFMREVRAIRVARSLDHKPLVHLAVNPPELF